MWRSFINGIKRAWKVFLVIIAIFAIIVIGGVVIGMVVEKNTKDDDKKAESVEHAEDEKEEDIDITTYVPKAKIELVDAKDGLYLIEDGVYHELFGLVADGICALLVLLLIALAIQGGAKNGASIFIMPDVNFLFPSPNKPQSVLMFRMLGQIGMTLMGAFYIVFQLPNLMSNLKLGLLGGIMLIIAYLLLAVMNKMISIFTYVICSKHEKLKRFLSKYAVYLTLLPVVIAGALYQFAGMSIYDSAHAVFASGISHAIPFWGWMKGAAIFVFEGKYGLSLLMLLLSVVGTVILVIVTWSIPCDFYEDALSSAMVTAAAEESMRESAEGASAHDVTHKGKSWEKKRENKLAFDGYEGAKVFFARTMLNRRRMNPLKGLWTPTASTYFFGSLGLLATLKYLVKTDSVNLMAVSVSGLIIVFMFFRSFMNPLQVELSHNFIYMVPESPRSLLGWGMLAQLCDGALDLLPACIIGAVLTGNVTMFVALYLVLVTMHLFFGMTALMVSLVVSSYLPVYISNMLQFTVRMIPFLPVIILFIVGIVSNNIYSAATICIIINLIASWLAFLPCPSHLHKGKR